jgi:hypothetical protein
MDSFGGAGTLKNHRPGGLKSRNLFPHILEARMSGSNLFCSETSLLGL